MLKGRIRNSTIVLIVISLLLFSIIPFFLDNLAVSQFNASIALISTFCTFLTLIIALLLYDKYGLKSTIKNSQLELVVYLFRELTQMSLIIKGNKVVSIFRPSRKIVVDTHFKKYDEFDFHYSLQFVDMVLDFVKKFDDIYLPSTISEALRKVQFQTSKKVEFEDIKDNDYLIAYSNKVVEESSTVILKPEGTKLDFVTFRNNWEGLYNVIKRWLLDMNYGENDLNLT